MLLTRGHLDILIAQRNKKNLINNTYLKDENNPNFIYCKNKRFANEPADKLKLLNVGSGIFQTVSDVISFYVGKKVGSNFSYRKYVEDFVSLGFFCFSLERDDQGKYKIVYQPAENYISIDGKDIIYRRYINVENGLKVEYILETIFDGGTIQNNLYKTSIAQYGGYDTFQQITGQKVSLETLKETKNLREVVNTGLNKVFRCVKEDENEQYPISMIDKIENIVYSIDRKILLLETQLLQHGEVFRIFKDIDIPIQFLDAYANGQPIDFSLIGYNLVGKSNNATIEYVRNENRMLDYVFRACEDQIRRISSITTIPLDFLGILQKEGNIGYGSRTLLQGAFIKKIGGVRALLDKGFEDVVDVINEEYGIGEYREDIFVKSDTELLDELVKAREARLISHVRAIQDYLGLSEDEAKEELEIIKQEDGEKEKEEKEKEQKEKEEKEKEQTNIVQGKENLQPLQLNE